MDKPGDIYLCSKHNLPLTKFCVYQNCNIEYSACCSQCSINSHNHQQQVYIKMDYLLKLINNSNKSILYEDFSNLLQDVMKDLKQQIFEAFQVLNQEMLKEYYLLIGMNKQSNFSKFINILLKSNSKKVNQILQISKMQNNNNIDGYDPTIPFIISTKSLIKQLFQKCNSLLDTFPFWKYHKVQLDETKFNQMIKTIQIEETSIQIFIGRQDAIKQGFKKLAQQAKNYNSKKMYDKALKLADEAIQLNPKVYNGYFEKAYAYFQKKQYLKSIFYYQIVIELDNTVDIASNNKGLALNNLKKYNEAIQCFDLSIKKNPKYANAYLNKGVSYNFLWKLDQSLACYNKAIELNKNYKLAYRNKAVLLRKMGKNVQAQQALYLQRSLQNNV